MFLLFGGLGRGKHRRWMIGIRVALLVAFILAAFVFHAHGKTLVELRVARYALLAILIVAGALIARRRKL